MRVSLRNALAAIVPWTLALLCVAGIVHLASVLLLPRVAPADAYARLSRFGADSHFVVMPQDAPEVGPFRDPALAQAVCFFDLRRAPLRIRANVDGEHVLTLSFHARNGNVFYAVTDKAALRGRIDVLVMTEAEKNDLEADDTDEPPQDLRLASPTPTGFVLVSSLAERPDDFSAAQQRLSTVTCAAETPPVESGAND
jgi:uncharacterized membrane protein